MPLEIFGYIASVFIGLILGLLGGGGSILSIPILVYLFHIDVVLASAYSLFIVGVTSFFGAIPKYKEQLVSVRTGLLFGIPSIISTFVTRKWIIHAIPDVVRISESVFISKRLLLMGLFAVLMIFASISLIRPRPEPLSEEERVRTLWLIFEGIIIGILTGLVGAGGGFLIIPALVLLTGLSFKAAVGTSLSIIAINSFAGFAGDLLNFKMDWIFLILITTLAIAGIFIGNRLSHFVSSSKLRKAFGWFTLVMGAVILIKEMGGSYEL